MMSLCKTMKNGIILNSNSFPESIIDFYTKGSLVITLLSQDYWWFGAAFCKGFFFFFLATVPLPWACPHDCCKSYLFFLGGCLSLPSNMDARAPIAMGALLHLSVLAASTWVMSGKECEGNGVHIVPAYWHHPAYQPLHHFLLALLAWAWQPYFLKHWHNGWSVGCLCAFKLFCMWKLRSEGGFLLDLKNEIFFFII